jgi:hypothetical protein
MLPKFFHEGKHFSDEVENMEKGSAEVMTIQRSDETQC